MLELVVELFFYLQELLRRECGKVDYVGRNVSAIVVGIE